MKVLKVMMTALAALILPALGWAETTTLPKPVLLLDFGQATAIDSANTEWTTLTGMSGKPDSPQGSNATHSHTYNSTVLGGNYTMTHSFSGAGRCFDDGTWSGTFAEGIFASPDKTQTYTTALAEMKATLGLINNVPQGVYGDSSYTAQAGYRTQKFEFTRLDANKFYVLYFIGGLSNSDGDRYPGFQLTTYNTEVSPVLSWARHTDTAYTIVDDPSAQINGDANMGAIIVRMHNVKPDANGNLSITVNSRKSPTNAIAIAELAPANRTLTETEEDWNDSSKWTLPTANDDIDLAVKTNVRLDLNTNASAKTLAIYDSTGSGTLTFVKNDTENEYSLETKSTEIYTDTDVSGITASLGAVTIAEGKTLTVGALNPASSVAGNGTIKITKESTWDNTRDSGIKNLVIDNCKLTTTYRNGGNAIATGRKITIDGENAILNVNTGDGTGYNANADGKIELKNGGKLLYASRDTLNTTVELTGGTIELAANAATSNRALDFYNNNDTIPDIKVLAANDATAENPTISYIKPLGTGANRALFLRRGNVEFNVSANAALEVSGYFANGLDGSNNATGLKKSGMGLMTMCGTDASTCSTTPIEVAEGTLKLSEGATLGTSDISVASGATLAVEVAEGTTKTLANVISGAGTLTVSGNGTLKLTASCPNFIGTITVKSGATLDIAAPTYTDDTTKTFADNTTITTTEGATVTLTSGGGYFNITGDGTVEAATVTDADRKFIYGMGTSKNNITANIKVPTGCTLYVRPWNGCAPISGGNLTVDGSISRDGGNDVAAIALASGKTLSGSGEIGVKLTLTNDTTIIGGTETSPLTISDVISGSNGLTVEEGHVKLTAANTYTGGTTINAGATLVLAGTVDTTKVLVDQQTITVNGTLELNRGMTYINVEGNGLTLVTATHDAGYIFGSGTNFTTTLSTDLVVNAGTKIDFRNWWNNSNVTYSIPSLTLNGTIVKSGADTASVTVAVGKTLSGSGTINTPITFANDSTIDASAGAVTVSGTVNLPSGEAEKVNVAIDDYGVILTVASVTEDHLAKFALPEGLPAGALQKVGNDLVYAREITLPTDYTANADALVAISKATSSITTTSITTISAIEGAILSGEDTENEKWVNTAGIELFNNVVTVEADTEDATSGVATVSYAFGIESFTIDADGIVTVTAKVSKLTDGVSVVANDGTVPTIAKGVAVELYKGTTKIGSAIVDVEASTIEVTSDVSVLETGTIGSSATNSLTIKAVK